MRIPKRYGESKVNNCPFCGKMAMAKNKQGVPVCQSHKDSELKDMKCVCGEWLDLADGKYGAYFKCMNCGNINFGKAIEMNPQVKAESKASKKDKEITVTSDQVDYMY